MSDPKSVAVDLFAKLNEIQSSTDAAEARFEAAKAERDAIAVELAQAAEEAGFETTFDLSGGRKLYVSTRKSVRASGGGSVELETPRFEVRVRGPETKVKSGKVRLSL